LRDLGKQLQGWEGGIYKKLSSNLINWANGLFRYLPVLEQALSELDVSGIMGVSLENALQRSSNQADVGGLTEEISAQQSRSRSRAAAGEPAVARERAPFLFELQAKNKPGD
jgi:hypothetical protein